MESSRPSSCRKLYTYLLWVRYEVARGVKLLLKKSLRDNHFRNFAVILLERSKTKLFAMPAIYALTDAC